MSNQIIITSGAKVRSLEGVLTGTSGVVNSLGINVANGIPQLDSNGKILVNQLPNSVMEYKGTWNVSTNTPTLVNGTGNQGDVYLVEGAAVGGTAFNFGAGPITFFNGDQVVYSGSIWQRASGSTGTVTSVAVTESGDALTITGSPITNSGTINIGFAGSSGQYVNGAGGLTTFPTLLSSVGLSMPSAFSVANSPLTANGTIAVTGAGVASQYVRGDGTLATLPTNTGGGSSVAYYFNGGTNQGTFGGNVYYEMSKDAVVGSGVDFTINANGYIAQFITDANDPALLNIPAGNWNFEMYFSSSANGGSPNFYVELYKYNGTTFTLIASSSANPEGITNGTTIDLYNTALAVPATALTITDRLAVRVYVNHSSHTITLHTQDSHLCEVITTFSTGLTALNGLTAQVQYFGTGTSGTDFAIVSSVDTHTFNLPVASAANTGKLSSTDWSTFNNKQAALSFTAPLVNTTNTISIPAATTSINGYLSSTDWTTFNNKLSTATAAATYVPYTGATTNVTLGVYNLTANKLIAGGASVNNVATFTTYDQGIATQLNGTTGNLLFYPFWNPTIGARINAENTAGSAYVPLSFYASNFYFHSNVNFNSTIGNGTYTYTLPSATGTIALTSNLSSYLLLSGGTLTGALSGTSATFSGVVTGQVNGNTFGTAGASGRALIVQAGSSNQAIMFKNAAGGDGTLFLDGTSTSLDYNFNTYSVGNALVIKNSGNVGIGTTSPNVNGLSTALTINGTSTSGLEINANGVNQGYLIASTSLMILNARTSIPLLFYTADTERMRITSGGNVLIGTTTDESYKLYVNGGSSNGLLFYTTSAANQIKAAGTAPAITFTNTITSPTIGGSLGAATSANHFITGTSAGDVVLVNNYSGNRLYVVSSSGGVYLTSGATSWTANSDIRLKNINSHIENAVDKLSTLQTINFSYKDDESNKENIGLIAQEVEKVFPELIDKNGEGMLGVRYTELIPVLIKAIQELKAEIDILKLK